MFDLSKYRAKFSAESDALILRMRANGHSFREITEAVVALGIDVLEPSVRHRWRWIKLTPEEQAQRRDALNARRRKLTRDGFPRIRPKIEPTDHVVTSVRPCQDALQECEKRRRLAPASLTAFLMGDPLPGYSALDQRK